MNIQYKCY